MDLRPYIGIGTVTYDKQRLVPEQRLIEQIYELDEDLSYIVYPGGYAIDLGWYPSYDLGKGHFSLMVVLNDDWYKLPLEVVFRRVRYLPGLLRLCSEFVQESIAGTGEDGSESDFQACVGSGSITYRKERFDLLKGSAEKAERLLTVEYPAGYAAGLWWDSCMSVLYEDEATGGFLLLLVREGDWDCPLATIIFRDAGDISRLLRLCSELVQSVF